MIVTVIWTAVLALGALILIAAGFCAYCAVRFSARRERGQTDREQMAFLRDWQQSHPHPRRK